MTVAKAPSPRVPRAPASPAARAPAQGGRPRSLRRRPRAGLPRGLSDDDPAGITTYSILGADHGYQLLWVLAVATVVLALFHDIGSRLGVGTGRGPMALLRERHPPPRWAHVALVPLVVRQAGDRMRRVSGRRGGDRAGRASAAISASPSPHSGRGAGPAIELPPRRAHTPGTERCLRRLRDRRPACASGLERSCARPRRAEHAPRSRRPARGHR